MGILEKTRAILVSRLGPLIDESSADVDALKKLIVDLEEARADITEGLGALEREVEYLENHERGGGREASLEKIEADIAEGEAELRRVEKGIEDARQALGAAISKGAGRRDQQD